MPKPKGFTAVMSQRVTTDPETLDFFPTPPWAARAGAELIKAIDPGARSAYEPACGEGHMAHGLRDYFEQVRCSDIHNYGAGSINDFLASDDEQCERSGVNDWIITNPPFKDAEGFAVHALDRAARGVALLCRANFKESAGRYDLFNGPRPLAVKLPFVERVDMRKGHWDPAGSGATAFAWFVWLQPLALAFSPFGHAIAEARNVGCCLELDIKPGAKKRLTKPSDYQFAKPLGGDGPEFGL